MQTNTTGFGYRRYMFRKKVLISAALLAIAGVVTVLLIRFDGRSTVSARSERRELLRLWESGSYDEVFNYSKIALESYPMDYFLLTIHGFSAYQLGISQINSLSAAQFFDNCIWSLRKALLHKEGESDGRLLYVLGKAYHNKGDSYADLSVKYLEKARALSYSAADIPEYLGLAYAAIGDYRNSVAAFAEALDPGLIGSKSRGIPGPLLLSIARSYFSLEELDMAQAYLQHCIDISPDSRTILSARLLLSEVLRKAGDNSGAMGHLRVILEETGDNAEAHYQLGEIYAQQGDTTRARAEWRLALRADPAHSGARARFSM